MTTATTIATVEELEQTAAFIEEVEARVTAQEAKHPGALSLPFTRRQQAMILEARLARLERYLAFKEVRESA